MSNSWLDGDTASEGFFLLLGLGTAASSLQALPHPVGYVALATSIPLIYYPFKRLHEDYSRIPKEQRPHKKLGRKVKETYYRLRGRELESIDI
jgi:hypothetical protein